MTPSAPLELGALVALPDQFRYEHVGFVLVVVARQAGASSARLVRAQHAGGDLGRRREGCFTDADADLVYDDVL